MADGFSPKSFFRFPRNDQRHVIVGRTGGGKTLAAIWSLSQRDFDKRPWIVIDFKGENKFDRIPRMRKINASSSVPKQPGIYRMQPRPDEHDRVDDFLWKIWTKGKTGVYIDEGFMLDKHGSGLQACLTQGRSLGIPMIIIVQRPVDTSPFVFTQADHFTIFKLLRNHDYDHLSGYVGDNVKREMPELKEYHSLWYDVGRDHKFKLAPVPQMPYLVGEFERRQPWGFWADIPTQRSRQERRV